MSSSVLSNRGFLKTIRGRKQREVAGARERLSLDALRSRAEQTEPPRGFLGIFSSSFSIIAEIKQASPSRGSLTEDFQPGKIAREYERGGASAISVLTDRDFFLGSGENIEEVKQASALPVLRKDFIVDEYQIFESRMLGADAVLLISELLSLGELQRFLHLAKDLGMGSLVEGHTPEAIEKATRAGAEIIGVNNRDLDDFTLDLDTSPRLRALIPNGTIAISESGIKSSEDLVRLREAGFHGALIGESLIVLKNREECLRQLLEPLRKS